jgi:hypothetical protein
VSTPDGFLADPNAETDRRWAQVVGIVGGINFGF